MVTSYYIMKMSQQKNKIYNEDYYSNLLNTVSHKKKKTKCRVCLKEGTVPIYGDDEEIPETLAFFADIQISEEDNYPKYLCDVCFKFVKNAILFRKTAKLSEETLRQPMKEEVDTFNDHDYDDGGTEVDTTVKWDDDFSNIKTEKKDKVKYAQKVTCHICKKVINRSYIKEHVTMHDPDHHKYVCEICGKFFRLRCAYYNHRLRHRTDFPYKCQFCPYRGRYSELLKTHMRTHTGDYRYMCTECPATFLFKSNLNSHMLKHKEPQYKCEACKRAFHTKLMLQRHYEADHLGIKNHVCSICGKAFGYRNAMMKHQRHVHKREKSLFGRMPSYLEAQNKQQTTM
uniref:Protein krueppel n=1 Tax=Pectinophora gossypiella TaxID=13191 RepID=A0A1E1W6T3_PECGO